jgi:ribosomal protein L21E
MQLFPHIKYVVDKFKHKLPKEDLKRYAKDVSQLMKPFNTPDLVHVLIRASCLSLGCQEARQLRLQKQSRGRSNED